MKKTKGMQRLWAFLLAFVLIATTVGNDGLTVLASENETEQSSEASSETHSAETSENTNSGGEEENSGENKSNQEEAAESSSESASESSEESSAESTSASQEEELSTETSEEESKTEENTESISEEANQNSKWKVNFNTEGDVKVFKEDGQEITGTLEVENGKQLSFKVEAGEGTSVKVTADNNELSSENGIYKINPDKDITVTVKAEKDDNAEASTETETETETITESAAETETETETETKTEAETETESETETEIETESEIETETEEVLETETEDVTREFSVVSFQVEGKGSITDADGNEIGSQVEVENKKSLEFYVNPEDGYEVAEVIIDGTVISRSDNKYAVSPSKDVEVKVTFAEKEEEEEEYVETIDTVEVNGVTIKVTTYSAGVLPKGYKVIAEEVSAGTVQNAVETKLEEKGKELVDLRAFDITILDKDGNEIQPKGGVSVQILGTGVEGENFDIYHMSGDEAQSVAENRKNSDVSFTANSFSIWVVAGSGSKYVTNETVYLEVNETKTLSAGSFEYNNNWTTSNKNIVEINGTGDSITIKGVRQGTAVITHEYKNGFGKKVKETTTIKVTSDDKQAVVAYFYVLLPEREIGSTKAGDYFYVGQGSVIPYDGDTQRSDLVQHQGTSNVVTYPDKEQVLQAVKQRYGSDIEVEDVIWYKTPWADGANSNTDKPLVNAGTKCYHVDGYVSYSTVNYTTVAFKAVPPGAGADADESNFELVDYYNKVKLLNGKATVTPTTKSATSINGYVFEGWYSDKACTQKVTDWTIKGPTTYYGHYVPNMDDTRELKYQVVYQTEDGSILDTVNEKVNIWVEADSYIVEKVESKTFTGYKQKADSPKLPQEVKEGGKVVVLYEADKTATKKLNYQVVYQVEGGEVLETVDKSADIWVLDNSYKVESVESKTFTGYKQKANSPKLPQEVKEGGKVVVLYEADKTATKKLNYQVVYQVEGGEVLQTVDKSADIWVMDNSYKVESVDSKTFTGYKQKANSPKLPQEVKEGGKVVVLYEADKTATKKLNYQVVYQLEGGEVLETVDKSADIWVLDNSYKVESVESKTFNGYKQKADSPKLPQEVKEGEQVVVLYEADKTATKKLNYQVVYQVEGGEVLQTVDKSADIWVLDNSYKVESVESKTFTGYKQKANSPKLPQEVKEGEQVVVLYEADKTATKKLNYQVVYQVEGGEVLETVDKSADIWVLDNSYKVESVESKTFTGYKQKANSPKLPQEVKEGEQVVILYEADKAATKKLNYQVVYQVEGGEVLETVDKSADIWVLDNSYKVESVDSKTFNGYKQKANSPKLPQEVKEGGKVVVLYEADKTATKKLNYQVVYQVEGGEVLETVDKSADIWVLDNSYKVESVESKTFNGYKQKADSPKLPQEVKEGEQVVVLYEADKTATKKLNYQVVYQVEGGEVLETLDKSADIWVLDNSYKVESVESKTFNGYKQKADSPKLPQEVKEGEQVVVLYEADKTATKKLNYQVVYQVEGGEVLETVDKSADIWVLDNSYKVENVESKTFNGYKQKADSPNLPQDVKNGEIVYVYYLENEVTIKYIADANGNVNNDSETILAVNGTATGSTAIAATGYHFVNWTNEEGTVVSTDETYVPERVNELYAAATYTAHFEEDVVTPPAPTPTPDEPTGTTPTVTAPTEATAVLGEAFAPVQPEVGVLGEAAAPEVGVLGEAKGPGTGDTAPIAAWSLIIVGAILTLGISAKKRKKEEQ